MPTYFHGHCFRHPCPNEITDASTPQVVKRLPSQTHPLTCGNPPFAEVLEGMPLSMADIRAQRILLIPNVFGPQYDRKKIAY